MIPGMIETRSEFAAFQVVEEPHPPLPVTVRPANETDLGPISVLMAEREKDRPSRQLRLHRQQLERQTHGIGQLLVAESDTGIVGVAKSRVVTPPSGSPYRTPPAGWYLSGVVVDPRYRRRRVGRRLTEARVRWVLERAGRVFYFADSQNEVSLALHRDLGFVEVARNIVVPGITFSSGCGVLSVLTREDWNSRTA